MTATELCDAWGDLLNSKDRGRIYDYFDHNRTELIRHVRNCQICKNRIELLTPTPINKLEFRSPQEFASIIRTIYNKFRQAPHNI
jgi:hypothetical protein